MQDLPQMLSGYPVMAVVRIPPDESTVPDLLVAVVSIDDGSGLFIVWNAAYRSGRWIVEDGRHDVTWTRALEILNQRMVDKATGVDWRP